MSLIKRICFSLRAAAEVFRATKTLGCDSPLMVMTRDEVKKNFDDMNYLVAKMNLLYQVIDHMVAGGSPCMWCHDYGECEYRDRGSSAPDCGLWDLVDIVPADREEAAHEQAAAPEGTEANP